MNNSLLLNFLLLMYLVIALITLMAKALHCIFNKFAEEQSAVTQTFDEWNEFGYNCNQKKRI